MYTLYGIIMTDITYFSSYIGNYRGFENAVMKGILFSSIYRSTEIYHNGSMIWSSYEKPSEIHDWMTEGF